jgi:hypothetical protein
VVRGGLSRRGVLAVMVAAALVGGCKQEAAPAAPEAPKVEIPVYALNVPDPQTSSEMVTTLEKFRKNGLTPLAHHVWNDMKPARYMVVFSKSNGEAHAESAQVGALLAEYSEEFNRWSVVAESMSFSEAGSWGSAPAPSFLRLGPDKVGFMMEGGVTAQGYTEGDVSVYGVIGKQFVQMLTLPTLANNGGTGDEEYTVSTRIFQVADPSQEFYPLRAELKIAGKRKVAEEERFLKVFGDKTQVDFVFKGGVFSPK